MSSFSSTLSPCHPSAASADAAIAIAANGANTVSNIGQTTHLLLVRPKKRKMFSSFLKASLSRKASCSWVGTAFRDAGTTTVKANDALQRTRKNDRPDDVLLAYCDEDDE
jgi:hypothetical protein